MFKSFRTQTQRRSPISEVLKLKGGTKRKAHAKELAIALPLTSLIDAFSIIVIYLLIGTQSGAIETPVPALLNLPVASNSQTLDKVVSILRIQKGNFFLNDKPVTLQNLGSQLADLKKNSSEKNIELMIQADQNMQYADLDPLIKAGSLAGIEKLKFAVMPTK